MFQLDGKRSLVSYLANERLKISGLFDTYTEAKAPTCVIYQEDPVHHYLFVVAMAGVTQEEPMFGPVVEGDERQQYLVHNDPFATSPTGGVAVASKTPKLGPTFGFAHREGVKSIHRPPDSGKNWVIWLSGRDDEKFATQYLKFEQELLPYLRTLLDSLPNDQPLFPQLWYYERRIRDQLHDEFRYLPPGASLEEVGGHLTRRLNECVNVIPGADGSIIGIYLFTGDEFTLLGADQVNGRRPERVNADEYKSAKKDKRAYDVDQLNAMEWAHFSTRPVLINQKRCQIWQKRLDRCGIGLPSDNQNVCMAPLIDLNRPSQSLGVILMTLTGSHALLPAHLFLIGRISLALSQYLTPLFPVPGFPWWPEIRIGRGRAQRDPQWSGDAELDGQLQHKVNKIVNELMPFGSQVTITPLSAGFSGARVFQLDVTDINRLIEIPRVLKVGPEKVIGDELKNYYQYAHNKRVGVAARVDIARLVDFPQLGGSGCSREGAIVYTFATAGDRASGFAKWASRATLAEINDALAGLRDQLRYWYGGVETVNVSAIKQFLQPLFNEEGSLFAQNPKLSTPSPKDVEVVIKQIMAASSETELFPQCVVHGDLHCGNLFALLQRNPPTAQETCIGVAVIDWGQVKHDHPLTDISRLAIDLAYKACWNKSAFRDGVNTEWVEKTVQDWNDKMWTQSNNEWRLALIRQMTKILFWTETVQKGSYLDDGARQQGWTDLQKWAKTWVGK